jgi:hypothetical protein
MVKNMEEHVNARPLPTSLDPPEPTAIHSPKHKEEQKQHSENSLGPEDAAQKFDSLAQQQQQQQQQEDQEEKRRPCRYYFLCITKKAATVGVLREGPLTLICVYDPPTLTGSLAPKSGHNQTHYHLPICLCICYTFTHQPSSVIFTSTFLPQGSSSQSAQRCCVGACHSAK